MIKGVMVAVGLVALTGPALARAPHHHGRHHHRMHHRHGAREVGFPIIKAASDVRINSVGEVIAPKIGKFNVDGKVDGKVGKPSDPPKTQ